MMDKDAIIAEITDLFGDTTKSKRETLEELKEIESQCGEYICLLEEELEKEGG